MCHPKLVGSNFVVSMACAAVRKQALQDDGDAYKDHFTPQDKKIEMCGQVFSSHLRAEKQYFSLRKKCTVQLQTRNGLEILF